MISDGLIVIFTAIGAVAFLFLADHLFRLQEERVEAVKEETVLTEKHALSEVPDESDEPNVAA